MNSHEWFPVAEALANLRASKAQLLIQVGLALLVGFAVVGITAMDTRALITEWSKQEVAGRSSYIVTSKSSSVSAGMCDAANGIEGVRGAGAVLSRFPVQISLGTLKKVDVLRVTRGYLSAAWNDVPKTQAWSAIAPVDLARRFGLGVGSTFSTSTTGDLSGGGSIVTIDWIAAQRSRVDGINDAIIEIAPPMGSVSTCLVTAEPAFRDSLEPALAAWFGSEFRIAHFLPPSTLVSDPDRAFTVRPSQWVALAFPLALVVIRLVFFFARRGDFALYRALGMTMSAITRMTLTEFLVGTLAPFQAGATLGLLLATGLHREGVAAVGGDYARALCILVLGALTGVLVVARGSALDRIRGG